MTVSSLITIIIPAYKASGFIARAVGSIQRQAPAPKVIVVIDGEDPACREVLSGYAGLTVVDNVPRSGAQNARNRALAMVDTPYVAFLDADDLIEGDYHGGMATALATSGVDMVFATWQHADEHLVRGAVRDDIRGWVRNSPSRDAFITRWAALPLAWTATVGWRTAALRRIGGWDPTLVRFQDVEVALRGLVCGLCYTFSDVGTAIYVEHPGPDRVTLQSRDKSIGSYMRYFALLETYAAASPNGDTIRHNMGRFAYGLAYKAFNDGSVATGRMLLHFARRNGFRGHRAGRFYGLAGPILGLERALRLRTALRR